MKKLFVVFLLVVACFSVVSAQTLEREIQQLNECCAHKDGLVQVALDTLNTYQIQKNIKFIWSVVSELYVRKRINFLGSVDIGNLNIYTLSHGKNRISISGIFVADGKTEASLKKHHIMRANKDDLQVLKALQNLDREKFVQELKKQLCQ